MSVFFRHNPPQTLTARELDSTLEWSSASALAVPSAASRPRTRPTVPHPVPADARFCHRLQAARLLRTKGHTPCSSHSSEKLREKSSAPTCVAATATYPFGS